jgi:hypothetical protein
MDISGGQLPTYMENSMKAVLLAVLLAFSFSTVTMATPAKKAKAKPAAVVKKEEKKEAPVTYKKPTRKKVVKK